MRSWGGILRGLRNFSRIKNPQFILSRLQISTGVKYTSSIEAVNLDEQVGVSPIKDYKSRQVASIIPAKQ